MPISNSDQERQRLERACIDELCRHGGTADDVRRLMQQFKQYADEANKLAAMEIPGNGPHE